MYTQKIRGLLLEYHEQVVYLVFGVATTLVNWIVYTALLMVLSLTVSQAIAWLVAVVFAFFVNKIYVFKKTETGLAGTLKELVLFFGARIASGVIEIGGLPLLVGLGLDQAVFGIEGAVAKAILSVVVIVSNYFFSKFIIFRKSSGEQGSPGK